MAGDKDQTAAPAHPSDAVERTIQSLAELHTDHYRSLSRLQRWTATYTALLARPILIGLLFALAALWGGGNLLAARLGARPLDPFPFPVLECVATLFAAFTTLLILTTQRHQDELAQRRSQLTLQLATLSEQKIAKVIELIEEQRRDSPNLQSRRDPEAEDMAAPTDPQRVLTRIVETHDTPRQG